jgi:hypothetical protein
MGLTKLLSGLKPLLPFATTFIARQGELIPDFPEKTTKIGLTINV